MKKPLISLVHPYGGSMENLESARALISALRSASKEYVFILPLDTMYYANLTHSRTEITEWCVNIMEHCDGIIVPCDWEDSPGCRAEVEAATNAGKLVLFVHDILK